MNRNSRGALRPLRPVLLALASAACLCGGLASIATAQQSVPFNGAIPVAPTGLEGLPLGPGPFEYATAEGMTVRATVLTRDIAWPSAMAFLSDGSLLVGTRRGEIHLLRDGKLQGEPLRDSPEAVFQGLSGQPGAVHGYMDLAAHPDHAENGWIYLSYTKPEAEGRAIAIGRGRLQDGALVDFEDIFVAPIRPDGPGGVARIAFDRDHKLYVTLGGNDPQSLASLGGKVLRLNDDGSVPDDNPFVHTEGARPEIFTLGHRNGLGLAMHPLSGEMWQNENGPNGGDEINRLQPGRNYGWPLVSLGRTYPGPWQAGNGPTHADFEPPVAYWMPAIAVSGMVFYTGDALPKWKGDVIVGALRSGEIPGTGHIQRLLFNQDMEELRREALLTDLRQRVRDVRQGPDGRLYLATDEEQGAILVLEAVD